MSHPSDKDLDRLVRAAAEQYDAEQNASGWETLRQRLDVELPPGEDRDRRRFLWLLLLITALTGGGLVWMLAGSRTQQMLTHHTGGSAAKLSPVATATSHEQSGTGADAASTAAKHLPGSAGAAQDRGEEDHHSLAKTHPMSDANGGQPLRPSERKDSLVTINATPGVGGNGRHPLRPSERKDSLVTISSTPGVGGHGRHPLRPSERKDSLVTINATPGVGGNGQPARYGDREAYNRKARINPAHGIGSNERTAPQMAGTPAPGSSRPGNKKYSPKPAAALIASNNNKRHRRRSGSVPGKTAACTDAREDDNITYMNNRKKSGPANLNPPDDQERIKKHEESIKKQEGGMVENEAPAAREHTISPATDTSHGAKAGVAQQADSNTAASKKPVLPPSRQRGWEIGWLAGPDISNVAFRNSNKTGYNLGLQLGYRFSRRWSVSAGVIYTKKNYDAQERDYHPSKPYSYPSTMLDMVEGYCQMLDIPVNLRYNLTTAPKATWFVSTGISSYFMKRQFYDFYLHDVYTGAARVYEWDNKTESNHLLSVLNISAGWERSLSKHFSIQAEPYLKMPLTGIGYGKMMINSYGLLLSIKYKPSFHSARKR